VGGALGLWAEGRAARAAAGRVELPPPRRLGGRSRAAAARARAAARERPQPPPSSLFAPHSWPRPAAQVAERLGRKYERMKYMPEPDMATVSGGGPVQTQRQTGAR
jgi:hypothetical protein